MIVARQDLYAGRDDTEPTGRRFEIARTGSAAGLMVTEDELRWLQTSAIPALLGAHRPSTEEARKPLTQRIEEARNGVD